MKGKIFQVNKIASLHNRIKWQQKKQTAQQVQTQKPNLFRLPYLKMCKLFDVLNFIRKVINTI